ncbi:DUF1553 domain-containing protein [Aureliella helgolandensis]|nr:DUF1553 domain-containing protein [Aureliella helgolandensis]
MLWLYLAVSFGQAAAQGLEPSKATFESTVAVIFEKHCIGCHTAGIEKGEFSISTSTDLVDNQYVLAGDPDGSYLLDLVTPADDAAAEMPKDSPPLSAAEIATLRNWIAEGAHWPDDFVVREKPKAGDSWWSLQPLRTPPPSELHNPENLQSHEASVATAASRIDELLAVQLRKAGLASNPPADRRVLIRRATYDLTGLPPSAQEVANFVSDQSENAFEKVVDRLLASPHYGERWGRHWLDVVRFGESNGYERNEIHNNAWPFRDYIIRSLNQDKPFDRLITEHLAGDVVAPGDPNVEVGSAFLVLGPYDDVGNQDAVQAAQIRANTLDEMIRTTTEAFLGLTVGCARCHDHKFDPILARDYYQFYSTFAGTRHASRTIATEEQAAARQAELQPLQDELKTLHQQQAALEEELAAQQDVEQPPSGKELEAKLGDLKERLSQVQASIAKVEEYPNWWIGQHVAADAVGPFHIFVGGDPQRLGEAIQPASLVALSEVAPSYQLPVDSSEGARRLKLAEWLTDAKNPLTPRVLVNRIWQYHFGIGIVDTPSDFGYMGGRPSHPELLDWLALELLENQWRIKPIHKLIMMSRAYQQSSDYVEAAGRIDGESRLLWRFPPRRLTAEEIRDTWLAVSGALDLRMGGAGFRLFRYSQDNVATYYPLDEHPPETYRRAIYHQTTRATRTDMMSDFDQPDCAFATPRRASTTTPLQALTSLNHRFVQDMSNLLASRIDGRLPKTDEGRVAIAFELCYARPPESDELLVCTEMLSEHGLAALCRVLLNTSELIYVE